MSTATYPQGMKTYNNHVPQGGYRPWKGTGVNSFPIGITPGNIRPFTNKDYFNNFPTGFGLPRPIKHYRVGRGFNYPIAVNVDGTYEIENANRAVKSSVGGNLVKQLIDDPGAFNVFENKIDETTNTAALNAECTNCTGIGVVVNYKPNLPYLTNNPEPNTTNPPLCCNEEKKALERVIYASTNLKTNYYTSHKQYMQNRCKLYNQKAFNFLAPNVGVNDILAKPGSPAALALTPDNTYIANCQCNADIQQSTEYALANKVITSMLNVGLLTQAQVDEFYARAVFTLSGVYNYLQTLPDGAAKTGAFSLFDRFVTNPYWGVPASGPVANRACNLTVYKPNNYKYAQQGAVSSSTRLLKLNVNTIETNAASRKRNQNFNPPIYFNSSNNPFILKSKVAPCNPRLYIKNGNPKTCGALAPISTNKFGTNAGRNGYKTFVQNLTA